MKPIRLATAQDAEICQIYQIVKWAYRGGKDKKSVFQEEHLITGDRIDVASIQEIISHPLHGTDGGSSLLVLEDETRVIGCIKVDTKADSNEAELGLFAVDPDLAGQGHGRTLLNFALNYAGSLKKTTAVIWVLDCRADILGWYTRQGFVLTGETADFPDLKAKVGVPNPGLVLKFLCLKKPLIHVQSTVS